MEIEKDSFPVDIECNYDNFEETIEFLKNTEVEFHTLSTRRCDDEEFCLTYFFQQADKKIVLKVKTRDASIPSLYTFYGRADFLEREVNNLFGIKFVGHPNLERIPLIHKTTGVEPYRKEK